MPTRRQLLWIIPVILAVLVGASLLSWYLGDVPITSPLTNLTTFQFLNNTQSKSEGKLVYGFVPYWNIEEAQIQPELTHVAYFGLTMNANGDLLVNDEGESEQGYRTLQSERFLEMAQAAREQKAQMELVLIQFDEESIQTLVSSPTSQQRLLQSLDSVLLAYPFTGINIDIEYSGEVTETLRSDMASFVATLNQHLDSKYKNVHLSIDMYAGAATRYQIWDVSKIAPHVDHIVIMAYDFHRKSSPQAGPVAPLFGAKDLWSTDIHENLSQFVQLVPKEKLLLGVPFYGYEWQTTSRDAQANTFPDTGATATFKRIQELLAQQQELELQQHWNETALSPYLSYTKDGETFVVYYENSRSLSYKLDYVNQLDLGGIAIWALGYEDHQRELWDVIERKL